MKVQFKNWSCIAQGSYYMNRRKAIQLIDEEDGSPVATATVNFPEIEIDDEFVFIKSWSENEGMEQALIDAGIITMFVHGIVDSGHVRSRLFQLTPEALSTLWN